MAKTATQLGKGALSTTLTTTLYTAPALTPAAIVKEIIITNKNTTTARNVTIDISGRQIMAAQPIPPNSTVILALSTIMATGDLIRGGQDVGTDCDYLISGIVYS